MPGVPAAPAPGRHAEARRNDQRILEAALDVFSDDLRAPMSAVAHRAGVGQASLYRRYPSKEALLARVCRNGMERMRRAALSALEHPADPWEALCCFLYWYLESGTPRLAGLLGSFTPTEDLFELARDTNQAIAALVKRNVGAGRLRSDITGADLTLIVTQLSQLTAPDPDRAAILRRRYLTLLLHGMAQLDAPQLPGPAPDAEELERPWLEASQRLDAEPGKSTPLDTLAGEVCQEAGQIPPTCADASARRAGPQRARSGRPAEAARDRVD